jgi:hypothetical protein
MLNKNTVKRMTVKNDKVFIPSLNETIEITSLSYPELMEFVKLAQKDDIEGAYDKLLFNTFRKQIPTVEVAGELGMTDAEVLQFIKNDIDGSTAVLLINKLKDISGLGGEEAPKKEPFRPEETK